MIQNNGQNNFSFRFAIRLHVDDRKVLEFIQAKLGKVYTSLYTSTFIVNNIEVTCIIYIFQMYPLNTQKYLNFVYFKKAYQLYIEAKIKTPP